ncbi:MAG: helix-hairpin-helix domain-containing protein [Fimbriimonadales bacterium]
MLRGLDAKTRFSALALIGVTAAFAGYTGFQSLGGRPSGPNHPGEIAVHVAGAVHNPGVHYGRDGMLVEDALALAGGETEDADLTQVNLAAKIQPNTQVYVPLKGEMYSRDRLGFYGTTGMSSSSTSSTRTQTSAGGAVVNINTADKGQLESLPHVGPVIAQRIIEYRANVGSFSTVEDLLGVKGIGPKTLEKIRPYVTVR